MKTFIFRNYMDKSYHALWKMMVTKLSFCSDYKILHFDHILVHLIDNYYFLIK